MLIAIFLPKNDGRLFLIHGSFVQAVVSVFFAFFIWSVWYNQATLPLATVFAPVLSPVSGYIYHRFTLPLADYYTAGEEANPFFWPIIGVTVLIILFLTWRIWFYFKRWKRSRSVTTLVLLVLLPIILGADEPVPTQPKKVETSIGIYDVQSKEDIDKFTVEEIRELVKMEDNRAKGAGLWPHPVLVYCFEERAFTYSGGKYENAEIKYRLRVPKNIKPGKKYPLVIHLHGVGEAGNDNTFSLAHLHSLLPIMIGPEQQDFFLLVLQCPPDNRIWTFESEKDGNLDIAIAAADHVIQNNPVDLNRQSIFGLSSGGFGVWEWVMKEPDRFAAAVPTSCGASKQLHNVSTLAQISFWTFRNKGDGNAPP